MFRKKYIVGYVLSLLVGGVASLATFRFFSYTSLPDSPVLQTLGIRKPMVIGFAPYWLLGRMRPESLRQLNRVTYFGLVVNTDGTLVEETFPNETEPGWLKLKNGDFAESVQIIPKGSADYSLLIHQSNEASISALLHNPTEHARNLVNAVEPIMKEHGFTDLNLDIESFREASPEARANYTAFIREVKNQMDSKKLGTLTNELTVSSLTRSYLQDPIEVGKISDHVVLMAYDYRYTGSFVAGAVAPVGGAGEKIGYDVVETLNLATQAMPAHKIILGIPLYGYEWETLAYTPDGPVIPGTGKTATTARVAELLETCTDCVKGRDELTGSPYIMVPPNEDSAIQQIYYEDDQSLQRKFDLATQYKVSGVAFWAIGYEHENLLKPLNKYANQTW